MQQLWSQDIFTKGEISPLMNARVSVAPYYNGLKTATNVITFPQGAAGKRFGTYYRAKINGVTDPQNVFFKTMQYLNECIYLIVIIPNAVQIYLEGVLVFTITGTPIGSNELRLIDHTVLDDIFRVATGLISPQDITRAADTPNQITSFNTTTNEITVSASYYTTGMVLPVRFSFAAGMGNSLFTSNPQVLRNKTYFLYFTSPTTAKIFSTAPNAISGINPFTLLGPGVGNQFATILNTWAMNPTEFINKPVYDFSGGIPYQQINSGVTFTPSAVSGNAVVITMAPGPTTYAFTTDLVGGVFSGNGGAGRIISVGGATTLTIATFTGRDFLDLTAILGAEAIVEEPAWSDLRGWPRCCSSFQNRAIFANTDLLPNGLWCSVVNDYDDFNDAEADADFAISWYPTSDDINFIRFIVPYRSLTIHTNSGVFSTPLSVETAITPQNFSLTIQDSTPAESVQPRGIDNQIIILSGNDAHSLLWDGFNNAYQSNIISIANEQLIRSPVDEAAFVDLTRAGSRYMLIVNADGSLAIYQTLISEDVQGFTPATLQQSYGRAYFRWVATSYDGRGWFVTERELASEGSPVAIAGFTSATLSTAPTTDVFPLTSVTACQFSTTTSMPSSTPQIVADTWYWAIGTSTTSFKLYTTIDDANDLVNEVVFTSAGTGASVTPWPLESGLYIEELSFTAKTDFTSTYTGVATSTITGQSNYNAQQLKMLGDGFGFEDLPIDDTVSYVAHGQPVDVSSAAFGFPINVVIEPLPLSIFSGNTKGSNLLQTKHIRNVGFMFADTVGGYVNGVPIAMQKFSQYQIGVPPVPVNGIFNYSLMYGWDVFTDIGITITHSEPFDIKLIGLFYKVDV